MHDYYIYVIGLILRLSSYALRVYILHHPTYYAHVCFVYTYVRHNTPIYKGGKAT